MKKLIKLSETHYIIVDDSEIKKSDWYWTPIKRSIEQCVKKLLVIKDGDNDLKQFKITHSNQPLGTPLLFTNAFESELSLSINGLNETFIENWGCKKLSLSEVEEAINGYSVEKMSNLHKVNISDDWSAASYTQGFKAHQELVKDKLFTVEQMKMMFAYAHQIGMNYLLQIQSPHLLPKQDTDKLRDEFIQSLLPKTEWDVEFGEQGKLRLI